MGYRVYLNIIDKKYIEKLKIANEKNLINKVLKHNKTLNETDLDWIGVFDIFKTNSDKSYEFGKYIEWTVELYEKFGSNIFNDENLKNRYNENDLFEINREGFEFIIQIYHNKISTYKSELYKKSNNIKNYLNNIDKLDDIELKKLKQMHKDINQQLLYSFLEWGDINIENEELIMLRKSKPYNLNLETKCIVNSWQYEYAIFELVRLYKSINWEKETVVIYGY